MNASTLYYCLFIYKFHKASQCFLLSCFQTVNARRLSFFSAKLNPLEFFLQIHEQTLSSVVDFTITYNLYAAFLCKCIISLCTCCALFVLFNFRQPSKTYIDYKFTYKFFYEIPINSSNFIVLSVQYLCKNISTSFYSLAIIPLSTTSLQCVRHSFCKYFLAFISTIQINIQFVSLSLQKEKKFPYVMHSKKSTDVAQN